MALLEPFQLRASMITMSFVSVDYSHFPVEIPKCCIQKPPMVAFNFFPPLPERRLPGKDWAALPISLVDSFSRHAPFSASSMRSAA